MSPTRDILVLSLFCSRDDVGEAHSNFRWIEALSAYGHRVTLLTTQRTGFAPPADTLPGVEVHAMPDPWVCRQLARRAERFTSMAKPAYAWFYRWSRRWLRDALQAGRSFDLVHQVSPLALRYPCPAVGLGVPFIVGPLAGSLATPVGFRGEVAASERATRYVRLRGLDGLRLRRDPWLRATFEQAAAVVGVAPYLEALLPASPWGGFWVCSEVGVEALPAQEPAPHEALPSLNNPLKLLFVGRVVRTKGLRDAVRAVARLPEPRRVVLDVVGGGPDRAACEAEAAAAGISGVVRFHGKRPRREVEGFYRGADVFLFPSFREPSGNVVVEAMSHGLPCIVANYGGPAEVVGEDAGRRVAPTAPDAYATGLMRAITAWLDDPAERVRLGRSARQRIREHFLWPVKAQWMSSLYERVVQASPGEEQRAVGDTAHPPMGVRRSAGCLD